MFSAMSEHTTPPTGNKIAAGAPPEPRLTGAWLRAARTVWIMLALAAVLVLLTSLPGYVQQFGTRFGHLSSDSQGTGGAAGAVAVLSGLASLAAVLLSLTLAAIFFHRRFAEPVAAALSFYLLGYAVVMAGPLEGWSIYWLGDASLASALQAVLVAVPSVALFALFPNGRFVPPGRGGCCS